MSGVKKMPVTKKEIEKALKNAIDPETGISMLDMGMIEGIEIKGAKVKIKMRPTSPFCPMIGYLTNEIEQKVKEVNGIKDVEVDVLLK